MCALKTFYNFEKIAVRGQKNFKKLATNYLLRLTKFNLHNNQTLTY